MEDKVIGFGKGIHREPSLGKSGELSDCVNLWSEGEEMKLLPRPVSVDGVNQGSTALFIHALASGEKHLVLRRKYKMVQQVIKGDSEAGEPDTITYTRQGDNRLYWKSMDEDSSQTEADITNNTLMTMVSGETVNDVTAIGNVLVVATSVKMYYFLWVDGEYKDYSLDDVGDLDIRFSLSGEYVHDVGNSVKGINLNYNAVDSEEFFTETVGTCVNSNRVPEKNMIITHDGDEKFIKGKQYRITLEGSSATDVTGNWGINIFPLADTFDENTSTNWKYIEIKPRKESWGMSNAHAYIPVESANNNWHPFSGDKNIFSNYANANEPLTFTLPFTCKRIYIVCRTDATRNFTAEVCELSNDTDEYSIAIDKTDSSGIDSLWGDIAKFVRTKAIDKNRFIYPFFVRYAVEMIDGTIIKPSAPILMIPNSGIVPSCGVISCAHNDDTMMISPNMSAVCCDLEYQILNSNAITELKNLNKVIRGIVIAVSEPIYTIDFGASAEKLNKYMYLKKRVSDRGDSDNTYNNGVTCAKVTNISDYSNIYSEVPKHELDEKYLQTETMYDITLPEVDDYIEQIENANAFYIIKRIELDELNPSPSDDEKRIKVEMDYGTLSSLVGRRKLEDNVASLAGYNAKTLYPYNNRLSMGNVRETCFKGYNPELMNGYVDGTGSKMVYAVTTVERNNDKLLCCRGTAPLNGSALKWFFYPDAKAKSVTINVGDSSGYKQRVLELKEHPYLNGAYYFGGLEAESAVSEDDDSASTVSTRTARAQAVADNDRLCDGLPVFDLDRVYGRGSGGSGGSGGIAVIPEDKVIESTPTITVDDNGSTVIGDDIVTSWNDISPVIETKNKILNSVINNPFAIDGVSSCLVGMGEVQKLVANTKALSQGQFGQHPVLAFCTDGIWALSVGSDSVFSAVQPITRDVCNNVEAITQTDSAVVFTTDKGLMMINGSESVELCKHMDNRDAFSLSNIENVYSGAVIDDSGELFVDMLKTCKMLYDYQDGLLWIIPHMVVSDGSETAYKESMRRMYAVSLKTKEVYTYIDAAYNSGLSGVGAVLNGPAAVVSDYPHSYIQMYTRKRLRGNAITETHSLMKFSGKDNEKHRGYLLTRAEAFGSPTSMKALVDMKLEALKQGAGSSIKVAVWVSNDRVHWYRMTSLRARSWKWYRFAVVCEMTDVDRITGLVCRYEERRVNKMR